MSWGIPTPQLVVQEGITGPLVLDARVQRVLEKFQKEIAGLAKAVADASTASGVAAEEVKTVVRAKAEVLGKGLFAEIQHQASIVQDVIAASERSLQMQIEAGKTELVTQIDQRYLFLSQAIEDAVGRVSRQSLVHYEALEGNLGMVTTQLMNRMEQESAQNRQHLLDVLQAYRNNTIERRLWRFLRRPLWKTRA